MTASSAALAVDATKPPAILRGTARGLEIHVTATADLEALMGAIETRLGEAPEFFRGNDVRIRADGALPRGALARLDVIAEKFDLRIVEIGAAKAKLEAVPSVQLAAGSAPAALDEEITTQGPPPMPSRAAEVALDALAEPVAELAGAVVSDDVTQVEPAGEQAAAPAENTPAPAGLAPSIDPTLPIPDVVPTEREATAPVRIAQLAELAATRELEPERTKVVIGPIRSGVILSHEGHLVIFGDVNPGADVRARGNIVVLGRLRGTAHAGIGAQAAFILALRLEPQQLRIGRQVARADESSASTVNDCEIAHVVGDAITVERYLGKLPRNLAASLKE